MITVGQTIYHGRRYWIMDNLQRGEVIGWNVEYMPYTVTRITAKTIYAERDGTTVRLPRYHLSPTPSGAHHPSLESKGKQYHSKFHEYFYVEIPKPEPKAVVSHKMLHALLLLGLSAPCSDADVKRAYKRKAREYHPDAGGSHQQFIELQAAYSTVLRGF